MLFCFNLIKQVAWGPGQLKDEKTYTEDRREGKCRFMTLSIEFCPNKKPLRDADLVHRLKWEMFYDKVMIRRHLRC